jgi:3-deoxy-D-manno-octulosonate 8-phosphate phosphatase (KDO 8-P phosphatase)
MKDFEQKAKALKLLITDVDGILTDGILYYDAEGLSHKGYHVHDGMGLKLLMQAGIKVAVITTCKLPASQKRMQHLGVDDVFLGQEDKRGAYDSLLEKYNLTNEEVAYVGDDLPDLANVKRAGLGITVADATPLLIKHADWVTERRGGERAIREICERILQARGQTTVIEEKYLA